MIKNYLKYFLILILIFFFNSVNAKNQNKIIVKVDEKIISSYEVKNKINTELIFRNLEINQSNINKIKKFAIQDLINIRIKEKEISKYKTINLEEVDISNKLASISSNNIDKFKKVFSDNNLDYETYIKELKIQSAWSEIIFFLFKDKVKINEEEILRDLENLKLKNSKIKEYDLLEIELSFNDQSEKEEKINKINKDIKNIGFEKSISIHSESESAINKGRLGYINEKSLSPEIYEKLKFLKEGQVSEPIIKLNKILYLKINKIKISDKKNFDVMKLKKDLINNRKNELYNLYSKSYLSKLKNNSYIEFK
jgi:hypothetical protein